MSVVVLGGGGFIGSHLVERLVALGHAVTVFSNDRAPQANLARVRSQIQVHDGDLSDAAALAQAMAGAALVYDMIWSTNAATSWESPQQEIDENLRPTLMLMRIAADQGVKKVVFPSSGGTVYGHRLGPLTEDLPIRPFTPYGIAKATAEFFLQSEAERLGIALDVYRIGNPYGPRQQAIHGQGVLAHWLRAALRGEPMRVIGGADSIRDYVYVADVAELMTVSLDALDRSELWNLGTGVGTSTLELLSLFRAHFPDAAFREEPARPFDNSSVILDSTRLLAHRPAFQFTPLALGMRATCAAAREHARMATRSVTEAGEDMRGDPIGDTIPREVLQDAAAPGFSEGGAQGRIRK